MKKVLLSTLVISMLFGCNCQKQWEDKITVWQAPNWTSDGKIVFLEHYHVQKIKKTITGNAQAGGNEKITVYEINNDGSGLKKIATIKENTFDYGPQLGGISSSSAGDWIVFSIEDWNRGEHYPVMYVIKRDGTNKKEIGSGRDPDFSLDASKLVYQKPDQGLWIMNSDGSEDHKIVSDGSSPAWSPDGGKIVYSSGPKIVDTSGALIKDYTLSRVLSPDWSDAIDTIGIGNGLNGKVRLISLSTDNVDTLDINTGGTFKWSPDGEYFVGYDKDGYFIIERDGTNKWYLKP